MTPSIESALAEAFDRFADFLAVQGPGLRLEAVNLLQQSLGLDDEARRLFVERLEGEFQEDFKPPQVLLGLILGLSAGQLAAERGEGRA